MFKLLCWDSVSVSVGDQLGHYDQHDPIQGAHVGWTLFGTYLLMEVSVYEQNPGCTCPVDSICP